jgi:uncharacterized protein
MQLGRPMRDVHSDPVVDAQALALRSGRLARDFAIGSLARLAELAGAANAASAHLQAQFTMVSGRCRVLGQVKAALRMTCQRCLRPMDLDIDDEFDIVLVNSEQEMAQLSETQEAALADAAKLDLAWLTEEQMLLALPLVPLHATCPTATERSDTDGVQRPFAQLQSLLKR